MPEPKKPKYNVGGEMEVSKLKPWLCRLGFHAKAKIETDEVGLPRRVCPRCGEPVQKVKGLRG